MQRLKITLASVAFILLGGQMLSSAFAQNYDARSDALALKGYDVVAYFTQSEATPGSPDFTAALNGKDWHFASAANRDIFIADPDKYQPQYNGHCAYAAALGAVASVDPTAWTLSQGKLYLNFSHATRDTWKQKQADYIIAADENWPNIMPK